jgi:ubiquinone/menaquinone biosynthesis C-methylase UbiE
MTDQKVPVSPHLYTEEYFLSACEGYDEFIASEGEHLSRRLKASFEIAAIEPGMKILDIGCGRGEIMRHCAELGAEAYGFDYAPVAVRMTQDLIKTVSDKLPGQGSLISAVQADAKYIPYASGQFDRVLMFDVVEHLHPWELHTALLEARRVLKPNGRLIIHTAPNIWYDRYAYPVVRRFRMLMGQGKNYPADPRQFLVEHNKDVHVNEQSILSIRQTLRAAGFRAQVWLDSPPQNREENIVLEGLRYMAFNMPPMRWFFERELFAVARKADAGVTNL